MAHSENNGLKLVMAEHNPAALIGRSRFPK